MIRIRSPRPYLLAGLALLCLTFAAAPGFAETRVGGTLQGQNNWTKAGSPYVVTGDLTIGKSATLKIGPGVTVKFKPNIASRGGVNEFDLEIWVKGTLIVEGAAGDSVFLTSDAATPRWEDWQGIVVEGPTAKLVAKNAVIEYALQGIRCMDGTVNANNVTVRRCMKDGFRFIRGHGTLDGCIATEIGNSSGTGMGINLESASRIDIVNSSVIGVQNGISYAQRSGGNLHNTTVTMCVARGVLIHNADPDVRGCVITGNEVGIIASGGANPVVQENNLFENNVADVEVKPYDKAVKLDFTRNWWGETGTGLIEERILDAKDDPSKNAIVLIDPILEKSAEGSTSHKP
ncbi:MAG TPA: right-handed parallel beta-helix repeat-containing protein [Candidatus Eisenbacteria bacterium]|nr:right-handed parallel beta-helix repeat-containing protein [Candidatus Eisenbacteria bacterium]